MTTNQIHWLSRWQDNNIAWHKNTTNKRLIKWLPSVRENNSVVFVPLCGKSLDMLYLLDNGFKIIAVELSELAIVDFFSKNNIKFHKSIQDDFIVYSANNITIFVGDYFKLSKNMLKDINLVYDRAALVALPYDMRIKYVKHLVNISPMTLTILLLTLNYPQKKLDGPPFAVSFDEVGALFGDYFTYHQLECYDDLVNEDKFLVAGVDFLEKASYKLQKIC